MAVVTDDQVAALRAQLKGQGDEHRRLLHRLKDGDPADDAEIIDFVTSVRLRLEEEEGELDPDVAEVMIKVALGELPGEARKNISDDVGHGSQVLLLAGLIGDAELTSDELEEFLIGARFFAEELRS